MPDFKIKSTISGAFNKLGTKIKTAKHAKTPDLKPDSFVLSTSFLKSPKAKRVGAGVAAGIVALAGTFGLKSCQDNKKADVTTPPAVVETIPLDHTHSATIITTPHKTANYVYIPKGGTNEGKEPVELIVDDNDTLYTVVNDNFAQINDENVYSVALDQAKANSEFILAVVNDEYSTKYDDVAEIPKNELLDAYLNPKNEENITIYLVNSTHEDFMVNNDGLSEVAYVNQEKFISDNEYVVIDPNWDGVTKDSKKRPIYKTVEEAILSNYRTQKTEEDNKLIESRWTDAYTDCLDGLRDDNENIDLFEGLTRDEAILMLRNTDFEDKIVLHMGDVDAQRVSLGCDEHGAKENITNGWDYKYSYLQSSDDFADLNTKDENDQYLYQDMIDLLDFYADPSDEKAENGKTLLDRYLENPDDAETYSYVLTAINNIIRNNEYFENGTFEIDGTEVKGSDLTAKQALGLSLLDKDGNPVTKKLKLGDAAYNIIGDGDAENIYIKVPQEPTPVVKTPPRKEYNPPVIKKDPPVIITTPTPEYTPIPDPDPTPEIEQTPDPEPTPDPDPTPDPENTPDPDPDPTPEIDRPGPNETPDPEDDPDPTPTPDPEDDPDPTPTPKPNRPSGGGGGGGGGGTKPTPTPTPTPDPTPGIDIEDNPQEGTDTDDDDDGSTGGGGGGGGTKPTPTPNPGFTPTFPWDNPLLEDNTQSGTDIGDKNDNNDDDTTDVGGETTPTGPIKPPSVNPDDIWDDPFSEDNDQSGTDIGSGNTTTGGTQGNKPSDDNDDDTTDVGGETTPTGPIKPPVITPEIEDPDYGNNDQSGVDIGSGNPSKPTTPEIDDKEQSGSGSDPNSGDNPQSGVDTSGSNAPNNDSQSQNTPAENVSVPSAPVIDDTPSIDVTPSDNSQTGVEIGYSAPSVETSAEIDDIFHNA